MAGGIRHIDKKVPELRAWALSEKIMGLAQRYLPDEPRLVRSILFDKTHENNWLVSWHQDRTIAVSKKVDQASWGPWSIKEGGYHVQVPQKVLDSIITLF